MAKLARAQYHARFAEWLAEKTGEELVEIRAYHLDQSVEFLTELEGAPPEELAEETAVALVKAAKRAIAREAFRNARTLALRALELRPTLGARYVAARAAWRLQDWGAVQVEMDKVLATGARGRRSRLRGARAHRPRGGVAQAGRRRDARARRSSTRRSPRSLADSDAVARFDAAHGRAVVGAWLGSSDDYVRYMERAYVMALDAGRKDLQTIAAQALASAHIVRLELDEAEILLTRALELAGESGSVRARINSTLAYAGFLKLKGELDAAQTMMDEVRDTAEELGLEPVLARVAPQARLARAREGRPQGLREAVSRGASHHGDARRPRPRAGLPGRARDDAGRPRARSTRPSGSRSTRARTRFRRTRAATSSAMTALAIVRAAQERDDEAEELFLSAIALADESDLKLFEHASARALHDVPAHAAVGTTMRCATRRGSPSSRRPPDVSTERIA